LPAKPWAERLGNGDRLAQTAQGKGTPEVAVDLARQRDHGFLSQANQILVARSDTGRIIDEATCMDACRLDRDRCTQRLARQARLVGALELAAMKIAPRLLQIGSDGRSILAQLWIGLEQHVNVRLVGKGFLVTRVQLGPGLGQLVTAVIKCLVLDRAGRPGFLCHRSCPRVALHHPAPAARVTASQWPASFTSNAG
jgi:hypothetical protein